MSFLLKLAPSFIYCVGSNDCLSCFLMADLISVDFFFLVIYFFPEFYVNNISLKLFVLNLHVKYNLN